MPAAPEEERKRRHSSTSLPSSRSKVLLSIACTGSGKVVPEMRICVEERAVLRDVIRAWAPGVLQWTEAKLPADIKVQGTAGKELDLDAAIGNVRRYLPVRRGAVMCTVRWPASAQPKPQEVAPGLQAAKSKESLVRKDSNDSNSRKTSTSKEEKLLEQERKKRERKKAQKKKEKAKKKKEEEDARAKEERSAKKAQAQKDKEEAKKAKTEGQTEAKKAKLEAKSKSKAEKEAARKAAREIAGNTAEEDTAEGSSSSSNSSDSSSEDGELAHLSKYFEDSGGEDNSDNDKQQGGQEETDKPGKEEST